MTLIKYGEFLKPQDLLSHNYIGTVVANNDPEKQCRIKVIIPKYLTGQNIKNTRTDEEVLQVLPWITQYASYGAFGRSQLIPEIGDKVRVFFPSNGNQYAPFYDFYFQNEEIALAKDHQSVFGVDYPDTVGYQDSTGTYIAINKAQHTIDFKHSSGLRVRINEAGKETVDIPDEWINNVIKKIVINSVDEHIELNTPAILDTGRVTDEVTVICPFSGTVKGVITKGNHRVRQNM